MPSTRRKSVACRRWWTRSRRSRAPAASSHLNILPDFSSNWDLAVAVFIMPIAVQWWRGELVAVGDVAQRMLASKSERDALGAVLFFNVAHYVLRPWPWILVALASLLVYPELSDIQRAFPHVDPTLVGHDIGVPGDAQVPADGICGVDGWRADCGEFLDDPDPSQLGCVVSRPRFLPPVRPSRRD